MDLCVCCADLTYVCLRIPLSDAALASCICVSLQRNIQAQEDLSNYVSELEQEVRLYCCWLILMFAFPQLAGDKLTDLLAIL